MADEVPDGVDASAPHSARVWNYLLGGEDNFEVDRLIGARILQGFPGIARIARLQRAFLSRSVRYLVEGAGIRQFLDLGSGLPAHDNTHQVAQRSAPDARVVYVDNDPLVLAHARVLLADAPDGSTAYVHADVRDTGAILSEAARTLDLSRPVALTMMGIMGQLPDSDEPHALVRKLLAALPSGSHLALSDGTDTNEALNTAIAAYNANSASSYHLRPSETIARYFDGLELVPPGVVPTTAWRPDAPDPDPGVDAVCGVGRKP